MSRTMTSKNLATLTDDLNDVIRDVNGLLRGIPDDVSDESKKVRRRLAATVQTARSKCRQLERQAVLGVQSTGAWMHERPYSTAGIVVALGVLVGLLINWRR